MFAASQLPRHVVRLVLETPGPAVLAGCGVLVPRRFHPAQDAFLVDGQKLMGDVNLDTGPRHFEAEPGIEQRPRSKLGGEVAAPLVDERLHRRPEEDLGPQPSLQGVPAGLPISGLIRARAGWACRAWVRRLPLALPWGRGRV